MRKSIIIVSGCAMLLGTAAIAQMGGRVFPRDQKIMDQWLAGKQPGEAVSCIPQRQIRSTYYVGGETILFKISNNLVYRNDPPGGCPGLDSNLALETRTPSGMLCAGDIAQVRDYSQGFSPGSCALGRFTPYRRAR